MKDLLPVFETWVPGRPVPQGSGRAMVHRTTGKAIYRPSNPGDLARFRADVTEAVRRSQVKVELPIEGAVNVILGFYLPRPKHHFGTGARAFKLKDRAPRQPVVKPDIDKLTRAVLDAITQSGVIRDDSQVTALLARKHYADLPEKVGCSIFVRKIG